MATDAEIVAFVSQPGVTDTQIAAAMRQYGVSPEQVAAATGASIGDVQSRYDAATEANQGYQDLVTRAYGDIGRTGFGTEVSQIDQPGFDYWVSQLQSGAITPENFENAFGTAAMEYAKQMPESPYTSYVTDYLVDRGYQDVFGREADQPGREFWEEKLRTGQINPMEFDQYIAKGATGLEDRLKAQEYLGEEYFGPEELLTRTGGIGYQEIVDYIAQNVDDPTKIYQRAQEFNVNPSDVYAAQQAKGYGQMFTEDQIQDYFTKGQEGFSDRYEQILDDTFGDAEERARLEKILGLKEGDLLKIYAPEQFSRSSIETIEEDLLSGQMNQIQDALIAKTIGRDVFGYTDDELKTAVSDLLKGKEDDFILNEVFDSIRSGNRMTQDEYDQIMMRATVEAPDSKIFKEKPQLLELYKPLPGIVTKTSDSKWGGGSGQYGYFNGVPILNAEVARNIVGDHGSTRNLNSGGNNYADIAKTLGMDFASHAETTAFKSGRSIFGIDFDKKYAQDLANFESAVNRGEIVQSGDESGTYYFRKIPNPNYIGGDDSQFVYERVNPPSLPQSTMFGGTVAPASMAEVQQKLNSAAEKLGIDTTGKDLETLFDEITEKTTGLYQVIGNSNAIDREKYPDAQNHVAALYKKVGDKLMPVGTSFFHADAPKKKRFGPIGGFLGEMLVDVASIPGVAELVAYGTGMGPAGYAALKGVQAYGLGADLDDIAKSVAMSYVGASVLPGALGEASNAAGSYLVEMGINPDIAGLLADAGVQTAVSAGMSAIQGVDIGEAVERSLMTFGLNRGLSAGLQLTDFPPDFQPMVARMLSEAILSGDVNQTIENAIKRFGTSQIKKAARNPGNPIDERGAIDVARGGYIRRPAQAPRRVAPIRRDVRKLIPLRRSGLSYI